MNEYLKTFENVIKYVNTIVAYEGSYQELKQSSVKLKKSLEPCIKEVEQSVNRLNALTQKCYNILLN
jgi:hypothetical protein